MSMPLEVTIKDAHHGYDVVSPPPPADEYTGETARYVRADFCSAEGQVQTAIVHLELARDYLAAEHKPDGLGSKSRPLRFVENALLALSQAYP